MKIQRNHAVMWVEGEEKHWWGMAYHCMGKDMPYGILIHSMNNVGAHPLTKCRYTYCGDRGDIPPGIELLLRLEAMRKNVKV